MAYLYEQRYRVLIEAGGLDVAGRIDRAILEALRDLPGVALAESSCYPRNLWPGSDGERAARRQIGT